MRQQSPACSGSLGQPSLVDRLSGLIIGETAVAASDECSHKSTAFGFAAGMPEYLKPVYWIADTTLNFAASGNCLRSRSELENLRFVTA